MAEKTRRVFGGAALNGTTPETTIASIAAALADVEERATGREVLWDTLSIEVAREQIDVRTLDGLIDIQESTATIVASAEAVLR